MLSARALRCKEDFNRETANCNYVFDAAIAPLLAEIQTTVAGNVFQNCALFYDDGSYVTSTTCFAPVGGAPTVVRLNAQAVRHRASRSRCVRRPAAPATGAGECAARADNRRSPARRSSTRRTPRPPARWRPARASRRRPSWRPTTSAPPALRSAWSSGRCRPSGSTSTRTTRSSLASKCGAMRRGAGGVQRRGCAAARARRAAAASHARSCRLIMHSSAPRLIQVWFQGLLGSAAWGVQATI